MQVGQEKQVVLQIVERGMDSVRSFMIVVPVHNVPAFQPRNFCGKDKIRQAMYIIGVLF